MIIRILYLCYSCLLCCELRTICLQGVDGWRSTTSWELQALLVEAQGVVSYFGIAVLLLQYFRSDVVGHCVLIALVISAQNSLVDWILVFMFPDFLNGRQRWHVEFVSHCLLIIGYRCLIVWHLLRLISQSTVISNLFAIVSVLLSSSERTLGHDALTERQSRLLSWVFSLRIPQIMLGSCWFSSRTCKVMLLWSSWLSIWLSTLSHAIRMHTVRAATLSCCRAPNQFLQLMV